MRLTGISKLLIQNVSLNCGVYAGGSRLRSYVDLPRDLRLIIVCASCLKGVTGQFGVGSGGSSGGAASFCAMAV